ncbi:PTS system beta-glucoside-specific EIIBCA component [compost metagenome]
MAKIEKIASKISPDAFKSLLVPLITLIIMIPLGLSLIAPLGYYIGTYISSGITMIYDTLGFVGVALLCASLPLLVMTGMHTMMTPYWTSAFASLGYDAFFLPAMIISNLNQGSASLAVAFKAKGKKLKSVAISCAVPAIVAGVTEPAMFGITLKYKKPLYAAIAGNAIAGIIIGVMRVACYAFPGSGGVFAIVTFVGPKMSNLLYFIIAAVVGMVVTFILTYVLGVDENE